MVPQPNDGNPGFRYYMTLMREDMQVRIGDCVYLMREAPTQKDGQPCRTSYRLMSTAIGEKMDIFRVERLWRNEK